MEAEAKLPKFRRPPLIEVVHGIRFRPLPMTIAHPGLFYLQIRDAYPQVQTVPPLLPIEETFGAGAPVIFQVGLSSGAELPRAWFVSADDTMLVQLQQDRLLLNWRRSAGPADPAEYPHFEAVSAEFRRVFAELVSFAADAGLGSIDPNQCEMTYINHIDDHPIAQRPEPAELLTVWNSGNGPNFNLSLDDLAFTARYVLRNGDQRPLGRLTAALTTLIAPGHQRRVFQLEITARGAPMGTGLPGVVAFHELAHQQIVRCFAGITTEAAHIKWERWQ